MALRTQRQKKPAQRIRRSIFPGLSDSEVCRELQKQRETFTHFKKEYRSWSIL